MKKLGLTWALVAAMLLSLLAGCGGPGAQTTPPAESTTPVETATPAETTPPAQGGEVNLAVIKGPSGVGAAELLYRNDAGETANDYTVTLAADNSEIVAGLSNGSIDIAAVASNVAANLYAKTDGGIQMVAVSGLGVLYVLENGAEVQSMRDLKGRTIYAMGQGANPEYVLNHLLAENGVDPSEVDIQWKAAADEIAALMASGEADLCMLPVPAATSVLLKNPDVRQALDLSAEWDSLGNGSRLTMTVLVARTEFAQAHPERVDAFLADYRQSSAFMTDPTSMAISGNDNPAQLVASYGITPNAEIAAQAIPQCALVCIDDVREMRDTIQGYYEVLYQANPASIGGAIPDDGFYYGG